MSTDNLMAIEEPMQRLKMAAGGAKKQPGLMKSSANSYRAVSTYVERIASAKDDGFWVAAHGTQQPLEILEAMDVPADKDGETVIACMHGQRAMVGRWLLERRGYGNLVYLDGWIEGWIKDGLPMEPGASRPELP